MASINKDNYNPEENLLATLNDLDIGFVKVSNDGTILNHNLTFNKIFSYNREENLIDTKILDYWLNFEERNKFREILFKNGIVKKYIAPVKKVDGKEIFLELNFKLIKNSNGEIVSSEGTFVELTERLKAEQKLKESEEIYHRLSDQYKMLLESITDGVFVLDKNWDYVMINKTATEMVQMSVDQMIGNKLTVLFPGFEKTQFFKIYNDVMNKRKTKRIVGDFIHPDGRKGYYEVSVYPVNEGILCITRDITEKIMSEQKLKESEEVLRASLESTADGILVVDEKGQISHTNSKFADMWRIPQDLIDKGDDQKLLDYVLSQLKDPEAFLSKVKQLYRSTSEDFDALYFKDGRIFERFSSLLVIDAEIKGRVWSFRDCTEAKKSEEALKDSERRLKEAQALGKIGYWEFDITSQQITWSDQVFELYDRDPSLGPPSSEEEATYYTPDTSERLKEYSRRALEFGEEFDYDFQANLPSGMVVQLAALMRTIKNKSGQVIKLVGTVQDITGRKGAEEELKSRYEFERLISLISLDFINVLDENLNDLINLALNKIGQFVNAVRCSLFIYSEDLTRVTNTNEWCVDPKDSQIALLQNIPSEEFGYYLKLLKEKKDVIINQFDDIPSEASGEREWIKEYGFRSLIFVPMLFKNKLFGTLGFYGEVNIEREWPKDIVNLLHVLANIFVNSIKSKQSEETLYHERDLIRTLLENHPDFIYFKDKKARFQHISKRFCEFFGRSMEEIIGKSDIELFPEEIAKITHSEDLQVIKTGIALINKEESSAGTWVLTTKIPWFDKDGNIKGLFGISHDITELKKTQEKLRELGMMKSEFLRRASHELKTPLISIKGFSDLILTLYREELNPDIISKLGEINQGCERLQNIINDLIHTSRLESTELKPKFEREDLSFLIKFCVHKLESLAEKRNQSIKLDIHTPLYANVEKEEIHDVITNLLSNAIKYTPPKGRIEIKTETLDDSIVVSIKDNGIGFTKEEKDRIFQQFGKIERYGQGLDLGIDGSGLGLYISKKIVESHGGKIWMESEGKNKGSIFYFSLPK